MYTIKLGTYVICDPSQFLSVVGRFLYGLRSFVGYSHTPGRDLTLEWPYRIVLGFTKPHPLSTSL